MADSYANRRAEDEAHLAGMIAAAEAGRQGWNLRCNRCGDWGATWVRRHRTGWGDLALCPTHEADLMQEMARHQAALEVLREVRFEQPPNSAQLADRAHRRPRRRGGE